MIEIREIVIKTSVESREKNSPTNELSQKDLNRIRKEIKEEIREESIELFSMILKNKKER